MNIKNVLVSILVTLFISCNGDAVDQDMVYRTPGSDWIGISATKACPEGTRGFVPEWNQKSCELFDANGSYIQTVPVFCFQWERMWHERCVGDITKICHPRLAGVRCAVRETEEGVCPVSPDGSGCPKIGRGAVNEL